MPIIKLTTGSRTPFTVTAMVLDVPPADPQYGPSHKFVGHTPDDPDACMFMSVASAVRQLGRLGLTTDTVVGQTIEFAKPGKYVDINKLNGDAPAPAKPNAKQAFTAGPPIAGLDDAPVATTDDKLAAMFALYDKCFDHSALASKRLTAGGITVTHEGIAAQTAVTFIEASRRGYGA